jgi:hypothetical protein
VYNQANAELRRALLAGEAGEGQDAIEEACTGLGILAERGAHLSAALVQAGAPAAVVAAAHNAVRAGHMGALEQVCWALWQFASGGAGKMALVQAGAPEALFLEAHDAVPARHAGALEKACGAHANLADGGAEIKTALVQAGAPAALVAAAREAVRSRHADSLVQACGALENLASGGAEITARLVSAGAAAALVAAAHEAVRARHAGTLEKACGALAKLASGGALGNPFVPADAATKASLVQAGAAAALVAAAHEAVRARLAGPAGAPRAPCFGPVWPSGASRKAAPRSLRRWCRPARPRPWSRRFA